MSWETPPQRVRSASYSKLEGVAQASTSKIPTTRATRRPPVLEFVRSHVDLPAPTRISPPPFPTAEPPPPDSGAVSPKASRDPPRSFFSTPDASNKETRSVPLLDLSSIRSGESSRPSAKANQPPSRIPTVSPRTPPRADTKVKAPESVSGTTEARRVATRLRSLRRSMSAESLPLTAQRQVKMGGPALPSLPSPWDLMSGRSGVAPVHDVAFMESGSKASPQSGIIARGASTERVQRANVPNSKIPLPGGGLQQRGSLTDRPKGKESDLERGMREEEEHKKKEREAVRQELLQAAQEREEAEKKASLQRKRAEKVAELQRRQEKLRELVRERERMGACAGDPIPPSAPNEDPHTPSLSVPTIGKRLRDLLDADAAFHEMEEEELLRQKEWMEHEEARLVEEIRQQEEIMRAEDARRYGERETFRENWAAEQEQREAEKQQKEEERRRRREKREEEQRREDEIARAGAKSHEEERLKERERVNAMRMRQMEEVLVDQGEDEIACAGAKSHEEERLKERERVNAMRMRQMEEVIVDQGEEEIVPEVIKSTTTTTTEEDINYARVIREQEEERKKLQEEMQREEEERAHIREKLIQDKQRILELQQAQEEEERRKDEEMEEAMRQKRRQLLEAQEREEARAQRVEKVERANVVPSLGFQDVTVELDDEEPLPPSLTTPRRPVLPMRRTQSFRSAQEEREGNLEVPTHQGGPTRYKGVDQMEEDDFDNIWGEQKKEKQPLLTAVRAGDVDTVIQLLAGGHANPNAHDGSPRRLFPLHYAAESANPEVAEALLKGGAHVDREAMRKVTPLHLACEKGSVGVVQVLLRHKADVARVTQPGWMPIHCAVANGHSKVVGLLLSAGARVDAPTQPLLRHPVHLAASKGKVEVMRQLLLCGANVNAKDKDGDTPLHRAAWNGQVQMVEFLLAEEGIVHCSPNSTGKTPLEFSTDPDVRALLQAGPRPSSHSLATAVEENPGVDQALVARLEALLTPRSRTSFRLSTPYAPPFQSSEGYPLLQSPHKPTHPTTGNQFSRRSSMRLPSESSSSSSLTSSRTRSSFRL